MSRLFVNESGRALPDQAEPITRWRHARVRFDLPDGAGNQPGEIWLCLRRDSGRWPLILRVNGQSIEFRSSDRSARTWQWHRVGVAKLKAGDNRIVLSSTCDAMSGWMLALENSSAARHSQVSDDAGRTWRSDGMGLHSALHCEYLIRLRVLSDRVPAARFPAIVYEDPRHPRVRDLAKRIPANIRAARDPWKQLLALRSWVARQWPHVLRGAVYAPWDPATVLQWTRQARAGIRKTPTTLCVHYGAVFAALATALGHRARCIAMTADPTGGDGHFVAEVFDEKQAGWVQHDPNLDVHYEEPGGRRLGAVELCDRSNDGISLAGAARIGPGAPTAPKRVTDFYKHKVLAGIPFRHVGFWSRNDYVSNPQIAPCHHGPMCYTETHFIWYSPGGDGSMDMFPHVTRDGRAFLAPPGKDGR